MALPERSTDRSPCNCTAAAGDILERPIVYLSVYVARSSSYGLVSAGVMFLAVAAVPDSFNAKQICAQMNIKCDQCPVFNTCHGR